MTEAEKIFAEEHRTSSRIPLHKHEFVQKFIAGGGIPHEQVAVFADGGMVAYALQIGVERFHGGLEGRFVAQEAHADAAEGGDECDGYQNFEQRKCPLIMECFLHQLVTSNPGR